MKCYGGLKEQLSFYECQLDYAVNGPLPDFGEVVRTKDMSGLARWCKQFKANLKAKNLKQALKLAVETGNINATSPGGTTALHEAVLLDVDDIVEALVDAGACTNTYDSMGRTALDRARACGNRASIDKLQRARAYSEGSKILGGLQCLQRIKAFKGLDPADFAAVAAALTTRLFEPGSHIVCQGDVGRQMFIIQTGRAAVKVRDQESGEDKEVKTLGAGDYFGERSLLLNEARSASVEARSHMKVYVLDHMDFATLDLAKKLKFKGFRARRAVHTKTDEGDTRLLSVYSEKGTPPATEVERQLIVDAMLSNKNLSPLIKHMSQEERLKIAEMAVKVNVGKDVQVVVQHDTKADHFYIVQEGALNIYVDGKRMGTLGPGDSFGELALIYRAPRAATVSTSSEAVLWSVSRAVLSTLGRVHLEGKLEQYTAMLGKVELFLDSTEENRREAADALVEMTFFKGEHIIKQGDVGNSFFLLVSGKVNIEKDGVNVAQLGTDGETSSESQVSIFGERALLMDEKRAASVVAASERVVACAMTRDVFRALRKQDARIVKASSDMFLRQVSSASDGTERQVSGGSNAEDTIEYSLEGLVRLGVLGAGAFGIVTLEKSPKTGKTFALKALSKGHIMEREAERTTLNEKWVMRLIRSPFVVRLAATFNHEDHLYFLMEPAMGGTLNTVLDQENLYGSQPHARFYLACTLRALEHLHGLHIIYRDLKPENLLLDARGYCKVTDFGLSKITLGHSFTACGTPEYFAPEMVKASGHTKAVDWWTLGVLLYELETSDVPFAGDNPQTIFANVLMGIESVRFPCLVNSADKDWITLVKGLCRTEASERLPMRAGGVQNVECCDWYVKSEFDWPLLNARRMKVPFKPKPVTLKNIDPADLPPQLPYVDPGTNWDVDFEDTRGPINFDEDPEAEEIENPQDESSQDVGQATSIWERDAVSDDVWHREPTLGDVWQREAAEEEMPMSPRSLDDMYGDAFTPMSPRSLCDTPREIVSEKTTSLEDVYRDADTPMSPRILQDTSADFGNHAPEFRPALEAENDLSNAVEQAAPAELASREDDQGVPASNLAGTATKLHTSLEDIYGEAEMPLSPRSLKHMSGDAALETTVPILHEDDQDARTSNIPGAAGDPDTESLGTLREDDHDAGTSNIPGAAKDPDKESVGIMGAISAALVSVWEALPLSPRSLEHRDADTPLSSRNPSDTSEEVAHDLTLVSSRANQTASPALDVPLAAGGWPVSSRTIVDMNGDEEMTTPSPHPEDTVGDVASGNTMKAPRANGLFIPQLRIPHTDAAEAIAKRSSGLKDTSEDASLESIAALPGEDDTGIPAVNTFDTTASAIATRRVSLEDIYGDAEMPMSPRSLQDARGDVSDAKATVVPPGDEEHVVTSDISGNAVAVANGRISLEDIYGDADTPMSPRSLKDTSEDVADGKSTAAPREDKNALGSHMPDTTNAVTQRRVSLEDIYGDADTPMSPRCLKDTSEDDDDGKKMADPREYDASGSQIPCATNGIAMRRISLEDIYGDADMPMSPRSLKDASEDADDSQMTPIPREDKKVVAASKTSGAARGGVTRRVSFRDELEDTDTPVSTVILTDTPKDVDVGKTVPAPCADAICVLAPETLCAAESMSMPPRSREDGHGDTEMTISHASLKDMTGDVVHGKSTTVSHEDEKSIAEDVSKCRISLEDIYGDADMPMSPRNLKDTSEDVAPTEVVVVSSVDTSCAHKEIAEYVRRYLPIDLDDIYDGHEDTTKADTSEVVAYGEKMAPPKTNGICIPPLSIPGAAEESPISQRIVGNVYGDADTIRSSRELKNASGDIAPMEIRIAHGADDVSLEHMSREADTLVSPANPEDASRDTNLGYTVPRSHGMALPALNLPVTLPPAEAEGMHGDTNMPMSARAFTSLYREVQVPEKTPQETPQSMNSSRVAAAVALIEAKSVSPQKERSTYLHNGYAKTAVLQEEGDATKDQIAARQGM